METKQKIDREINVMELVWNILFCWRQIICFGVIFAIGVSCIKYVHDNRTYQIAQNSKSGQNDSPLTLEEEEQIEDAKRMMMRIENYQGYLDESALMQINPYEKPIIELQYYVKSDYTYNYTKDNQNDYTGDLMSLYCNYVNSGELSQKIIDYAGLAISQADFSELCGVYQSGKTMVVTLTWAEEEKLETISQFLKSELLEKEREFQEVGSHKLKLLRESQNVIADTELAEEKNTIANNIVYIETQLNALKASMTEQQLAKLRGENDVEQINDENIITKPSFSLKFAVLGAICGIFLMFIWISFKTIFAVKLQNSGEICTLYDTRLLGEIIIQQEKKKFLSIIDDKLLAIKNRRIKKLSVEQQIKIVAANTALLCRQRGIEKIYMTGSEYESMDDKILSAIKQELEIQNVQIIDGINIVYEVDSLKRGVEIGNMLFIEQVGKSIYNEISNELNLAKEQMSYVLGVIVLL